MSTLALSIGAHMLREVDDSRWYGILGNLLKDMGEPVIRKAALQAMQVLGKHYVCGRTIEEAIARSYDAGHVCSFDVLGEAAKTRADADKYFAAYMGALETLGSNAQAVDDLGSRHGISVKLSSLHPRYEFGQADYVLKDISSKLLELCQVAKKYNVKLTVDAEEARRLELSLMILDTVFSDSSLNGWEGLGFVIQAYQKRALAAIDFVEDIAIRANRKMIIRLVKGAYWDYEIRNAQEMGLDGYPVFTRKVYTDVSYFACVQKLLSKPGTFYPVFGTHNAHSVSFILEMTDKDHPGFEFQRLHGMAQDLYDYVTKEVAPNVCCRVYTPIGQHQELLPYLMRRLIENGANVSFVNMINDSDIPAECLCADPLEKAQSFEYAPHPYIPLPADMFPDGRVNSAGVNTSDSLTMLALSEEVSAFNDTHWKAYPIIGGQDITEGELYEVFFPASLSTKVGEVLFATAEHAAQ
ncbi:proline dehydrogenase family protein, partial [Anaplasma marginale]|uniref:proline dehydrogenase family protein n=1 Tax=Anaplasma marginale TaxID=770 RepID=UPI001F5234D2